MRYQMVHGLGPHPRGQMAGRAGGRRGRYGTVIGLRMPIVLATALAVAAVALAVSLTPARRPAASPTEGLPAAPDMEIVMYQGAAAVGGNRIRLSQLWGRRKPVVLNYFAGLCPPCRAELPDFQRLYSGGAQDKFTLIGVDVGPFVGLGSRDDGRALLQELKIAFPTGTTFIVGDFRRYGILGMPTTVFITADGKIFKKYTGMLTRDQMNTLVGELLRASGPF